jgi:hypothetical protein
VHVNSVTTVFSLFVALSSFLKLVISEFELLFEISTTFRSRSQAECVTCCQINRQRQKKTFNLSYEEIVFVVARVLDLGELSTESGQLGNLSD